MLQAVAFPAPPSPPPTPQNQDFGQTIKQTVDDALAGALAGVRAELKDKIASMTDERAALQRTLQNTSDSRQRRELQREIARLDNRIHDAQVSLEKLESRLTTTDAPRTAGTTAPTPPVLPRIDNPAFNPAPMIIAIMGILFVAFPIALTFARLMWRRASSLSAAPPALTAETARRFDRLEQSVDAIAIEIERISENQRYLTKVLSEPKQERLV